MFPKTLILLTIFYTISEVICLKKSPCVLTDAECTTQSAKHLAKFIGLENPTYGTENLDPMHLNIIEAILPNLNYTLKNVTLRGLKDCDTIQLKLNADDSFYYYIMCSRLTVEGYYELDGYFAAEHVVGKGTCKIVHDDYHIGSIGQHKIVIGEDGKEHFHITKYIMDLLDVQGNIVYKFENLFYGDEEKSKKIHKYINSNWKKVSAVTQYPAMNAFMGKFYDNVNKFYKYVPKDEMFYTYV